MKNLFTSVAFLLAAFSMQAKEYSGNLNIFVADMGNLNINQNTTITVNQQTDGKYELIIKNFYFEAGSSAMNVGTIHVTDVEGKETGDITKLAFDGETTIQPNKDSTGELQGVPVAINLNALLNGNDLGANITINALGMDIKVDFTPAGTYIQNFDFEKFHTATYTAFGKDYTSEEANHWHSFTSAKAGFGLGTARQQKQSFMSEDVRENSYSTKCLLIKSALPFNVPANGTVTTGRLNAGSAKPSSTSNHAFLDISNTDVDDNGDPFYALFTAKPDAIEFWTRFKQGQDNLSYKFASLRAVITDGSYYQDPEDKTYSNIVAVAANKTIEGTDVWQKVTANFDYDSYKPKEEENKETKVINPKAILVTISTNAEPGVASKDADNPDYIYIDDLSLIYNANLKSLKLNNTELFEAGKTEYTANANGVVNLNDIEVESDGNGAYISKTLEEAEGGCKATITITSNDLKTQNVYVLNIKGATTGINKPQTVTTQSGVKAVYNLSGQQVSGMSKAGVYIVERNDGTTVKVLKK